MLAETPRPDSFALTLAHGAILRLTTGRPRLMGIVNVTPDSFSDGGRFLAAEQAVERALELVDEGAEILDLGAESTRPPGSAYGAGASAVDAETEIARLLPVVAALRRQSDVPISIDTRKADVLRRMLDAGADLLNDVSALEDPATAAVAARAGCPVVLMHHHGIFATARRHREGSVVDTVRAGLAAAIDRAVAAGCRRDQLVVDPGLGFGKVGDENYELLRQLSTLQELGCPLLVGASRKSFLVPPGSEVPPADRLPESLGAAAWAALGGAAVLRVHDVGPTRRFLAAFLAASDRANEASARAEEVS